ncbi:MAG: transcription/translation regulatory transformer protein RfaH [Xanthomonadaceae bacterium]|nr:transcription/translation regulatory transformer protein RfaH [Xanthomonadaceae bacterium]
MSSKWRVVYCRARQEGRARLHLLNQNYEVFLPLLRSRRRVRGHDRICIEPMFPRYLFLALDDHKHNWAPIRSTRGVVGLVRLGDQVPSVPPQLIEALKARHDEHEVIDLARDQHFAVHDPVEIAAGPLAGYRGLFDGASGSRRVRVLLEILNCQRRIEVPIEDIRRA